MSKNSVITISLPDSFRLVEVRPTGLPSFKPFAFRLATGIGTPSFNLALQEGKSGIRLIPELIATGVRCTVAGIPLIEEKDVQAFCNTYKLTKLRSSGVLYGCMAGVEAWLDAGMHITNRKDATALWNAGCVFGSDCAGVDAFDINLKLARTGNIKKVGGRIAQQAMNSGVSGFLGGILGLGNQVTTNASEGNTGIEPIIHGYRRIKRGMAAQMLVGSTEGHSRYLFGAYDSILADDARPATCHPGKEAASIDQICKKQRQQLGGIIPGAGSGALLLESLTNARKRKCRIYAEIIGGNITSGGQLHGLMSLTPEALEKCIARTLTESGTPISKVDAIVGHFQSNYCDHAERTVYEHLHN